MKSIRLNADIKETVTKTMLTQFFANKRKQLTTQKELLGYKLIDFVLGEHKESFVKLPESIKGKESNEIEFYVEGKFIHIFLKQARYIPSALRIHRGLMCTIAENPIAGEILAIAQEQEELNIECTRKQTEIRVILSTTNTTKQLEKIWPEALPFLPAWILDNNKAAPLPAVQLTELNRLIKLTRPAK